LIIFFDFFEHTSYVVKKLKEFFDNTHSVLKNTHSVFKPLLSFFLLFKKSTKIIQRFRFLIRFFLKNLCFFLIKTNLMFWCFFYWNTVVFEHSLVLHFIRLICFVNFFVVFFLF